MNTSADSQFPATHWSLIARIKSGNEAVAARALDEICAQYHFPLYCYIRRLGLSHHDAQDALHDFLTKLIRIEAFEAADAAKGRLRSFLAVALRRFLIDWRHSGFRRRQEISIETANEARYQDERFASTMTAEMALDRIWAMTLLQSALDDLADSETKAGRGGQFATLRPFLTPADGTADYDAVAGTLGQAKGTVRQMVRRLREKFRELLRERVAETLSRPSEEQIDEEMKALREMMRG